MALIDGVVFRAPYGVGSKSEHEAVMIRTASGDFLVRRRECFDFIDEEIGALAGRRITGEGLTTETTVILDDWSVAPEIRDETS